MAPLRAPASVFAFCLVLAMALSPPARAAEAYDNCAYTLTTLPAVISSQGVWCMKKDLANASTSGALITINTSNVTLDCNGFKLGGLAAGTGTQAIGVQANGRSNVIVRNCNIRGFHSGVMLAGNGSYLVEDNRFDWNTSIGIRVEGGGSIVRRNIVSSTGGSTLPNPLANGIHFGDGVEVTDNSVRAVSTSSTAGVAGIAGHPGNDAYIARNVVGDIDHTVNDSWEDGILIPASAGAIVENNRVFGNGNGTGIHCYGTTGVRGNVVSGMGTAITNCSDLGENDSF